MKDIDAVIDYLCSVGHEQKIFFLWRPVLRDPDDEIVLETAVAGGCAFIVTFTSVTSAASNASESGP
jgi:predicted nucleic acid-binding protein